MKKLLLVSALILAPVFALAAGGSNVKLDHIEVDATNHESLQRGMQLYVNYCLGCHSAQYQRYERAARDLEIPADLVLEHLVHSGQKIGEQMTNAMDADQAQGWFGAPPPDLTNEVNLRGADWVYTYLRSFYVDESRPYGVNNVVYPNVGMPNVLAEVQGIQRKGCGQVPMVDDSGKTVFDTLTGKPMTEQSCEVLLVDEGTGELTPAEFDQAMYDLTNFLAYTSKPYLQESKSLGVKVILFLLFMTVIFYFLYKEYWRDIH
jgi:ubiquinol-cytochrome c reductase cytochrome c1 subunit